MKKVLLPLVGAGIFLLDESLKNYVEENLQPGTEKKLTGRIVLRRVHNQGVGFELLSECPEEVKKLSLAVTTVVTGAGAVVGAGKGRILEKLGLTLTAAGAWSNTWDRFRRGYVVDYIGIRQKNKKIRPTDIQCRRFLYRSRKYFVGCGKYSEIRKKPKK